MALNEEWSNGEHYWSNGQYCDEEAESSGPSHQPGVLKIHNVLACASLGCLLNLEQACDSLKNAIYDTGEMPAMRIRRPNKRVIVISVFSNGKLTAAGADSSELAERAMRKLGVVVGRKLGLQVQFSNFEVKNMFGSLYLGCYINLRKLLAQWRNCPAHSGTADYNPEMSPAVKIQIPIKDPNPKANLNLPPLIAKKEKQETVTIYVFNSGNVTVQGARSRMSIEYSLDLIRPFLEQSELNKNTTPGALAIKQQPADSPVAEEEEPGTPDQAESSYSNPDDNLF